MMIFSLHVDYPSCSVSSVSYCDDL